MATVNTEGFSGSYAVLQALLTLHITVACHV